MSGLKTSTAWLARFDAILRAMKRERGQSFTLADLSHARALAEELDRASPDAARVEDFAARLGVDVGTLARAQL